MLSACTETAVATNTDAEIKAIKDGEVQWNKDFEAKDAAKLGAHYTEDAILMNPGMPAAKGKAAIQKAFGEMVTDPAFSLKFEADRVEVAKSGDLGYTQGHYTLTVTDAATKKPFTDHGSYVTIYKKQADGWKAVQDAAISEVPPPAPPAAPAKKK
jgi:ketosteroid isomerase-like protein